MTRLIGLGLLAFGCSATDPASERQEPLSCAKTDRTGTYFVTYTTVSGDCGDIPDGLGRLDDAEALPDICALDAADRWSDGDCKLERAYSCLEAGIGPGVQSHTIAVTTQDDDSGARITGTITMRITDPSGVQLCNGTYQLSAVRQ